MTLKRLLTPVLWCVFAALPLGHALGQPDLTGTWILDSNLSDDPARVLRDASERASKSGGVMRQAVRGISIFGIPVGSLPLPGGGGGGTAESPEIDHLLNPVAELRILRDDDSTELGYGPTVLVAYEHDVSMTFENSVAMARWTRDRLVVEHELDDGTDIKETYRLVDDRLHWTVTVKAKRAKRVEIHRVFARKGAPGLGFVAAAR